MITLEDCIAFCGLTREELAGIAEHEHLPESAAAAFAAWMMERSETGIPIVREMLRDDIRAAISAGNHAHAAELIAALRHFMTENPQK